MPKPPLPEGCGLPGLRGKCQLLQWIISIYGVRLSEVLALALSPVEHFQVLALSLGSPIPWQAPFHLSPLLYPREFSVTDLMIHFHITLIIRPDKYRTMGDVLKRQVVFDHFITTDNGDRIRSFFPPLATVSAICGTLWVQLMALSSSVSLLISTDPFP
jgi:hypothetical protein